MMSQTPSPSLEEVCTEAAKSMWQYHEYRHGLAEGAAALER